MQLTFVMYLLGLPRTEAESAEILSLLESLKKSLAVEVCNYHYFSMVGT